VASILIQAGHEVFTPTLTGVGERSHLLTPNVNLDTHILDVVNEMKWQELKNVVLVGHSYAGMVITGVAEQMEKVDNLVRDAGCLLSGNRGGASRFAATIGSGRFSGCAT
jgi:hypothetical protein